MEVNPQTFINLLNSEFGLAVILLIGLAAILVFFTLIIVYLLSLSKRLSTLAREVEGGNLLIRQTLLTNTTTEKANLAILKNEINAVIEKLSEQHLLFKQQDDSELQRELHFQSEVRQQLEKMHQTIVEQLHVNLDQRLTSSFDNVVAKLSKVHEGLGEVNLLSKGMADLHKALANVKTRGIWGELQLERLLEQMLTPDQYRKNFKTSSISKEMVEFAIQLPGNRHGEPVWLPIDSKFPLETYYSFLSAEEQGDQAGMTSALKSLENQIRSSAKQIANKYITPPLTTDFAVLFLPSESLYSTVLRIDGLIERLQIENRITISGPSSICALLCSLQMGFRSLQIQERAAEVWKIMSEIKSEFYKFGITLDGVKRKLAQAHDQMDDVGKRSRVLQKRLHKLAEIDNKEELLEELEDEELDVVGN